MEKWIALDKIKSYISLNWLKLLIIVMIAFIFIRKDFSFSINLNSPLKMEEKNDKDPAKRSVTKKEPLVTEKRMEKAVAKSQSSFFDRFELPFIGKGNSDVKKQEMAEVSDADKLAYIRRFAQVAVNEQKKFGIPASIILANALVNSFAGKRDMALRGNNHFGIPCTASWKGESGTYHDACYRHYESAWTSFRDHSVYLSDQRFGSLRKLGTTDYKGWAEGLEKLGYSDLNKLEDLLINTIETFELYTLDRDAS